jgi:hypothetical protein
MGVVMFRSFIIARCLRRSAFPAPAFEGSPTPRETVEALGQTRKSPLAVVR